MAGNYSETLALYLIDKHLQLAKTQRGVTRRDQIAALVLPAVVAAADASTKYSLLDGRHTFLDTEQFDNYCVRRAYGIADCAEKQAHG